MEKKRSSDDFDAFTLFPEVMDQLTGEVTSEQGRNSQGAMASGPAFKPLRGHLSNAVPPAPPDVSWLSSGVFEDQENIGDVAAALVLMRNIENLREVSKTLEDSGYQVESTDSANQALGKLTATTYGVVVLHSWFEGGMPLDQSKIHTYLAKLPMVRRRRIHYILVVPEFQTLYDLEALSLSANLVISDDDLDQLPGIFKKSFRDYTDLFGPLLESLGAHQ